MKNGKGQVHDLIEVDDENYGSMMAGQIIYIGNLKIKI